jgi:hypothetical protein
MEFHLVNQLGSEISYLFISYLFISYLFISYLFISYLFISYLFISYLVSLYLLSPFSSLLAGEAISGSGMILRRRGGPCFLFFPGLRRSIPIPVRRRRPIRRRRKKQAHRDWRLTRGY